MHADLVLVGFATSTESTITEINGIGTDHRRANSIRASPCVLRRDMLKYLYANAKRVHRYSSRITPVVLLVEPLGLPSLNNNSILRIS